MTFKVNIKFLISLSLFAAVLLISCNNNADKQDLEAANLKADSLSIKLNSPELKDLNKQLLENPGSAELYHKRAKVYLSLRELDESVNDSKRAIRLDSTQADYYLGLVDAYFSQNKTRLAKDLLEIIEKKFPENTQALLKLAELYWLVKQYQKGIEYVNKALKIDEHLARGYYIKGGIYRESGDTARALSSLETATEQDNTYQDAYHDLGVIYGARKNPVALQYYDNVLRINPNNESTLYARAKLLQDLGRTDEAITEYTKIITVNNNCSECYYNLGAIYLEIKKDNKKAIENFNKAIETNPEYADAYFARGFTYFRMNDKEKAKADYQTCLKIQPNHEAAIAGLNEL